MLAVSILEMQKQLRILAISESRNYTLDHDIRSANVSVCFAQLINQPNKLQVFSFTRKRTVEERYYHRM